MTQSNASRTGLVVDLEWRLTLFTLTMLPVLVVLGFWQLDRAEEKAALVAEHEARKDLPPIDINAFQGLPGEARGERQIHFRGDVLPGHYLLLDNRTRRGRFGYEVVAFVDTNQVIVPLNLGWVEGDPARRRLPEVSLPKGTIDWLGRAHTPTANAFVLADEAFPTTLPAVVQALPLARWSDTAARQLGGQLLPVEVRIAPNSPVALAADWAVVNQTSAKHQGYAVQWFTMAFVLLIAFIFRSSNLWSLLRGER